MKARAKVLLRKQEARIFQFKVAGEGEVIDFSKMPCKGCKNGYGIGKAPVPVGWIILTSEDGVHAFFLPEDDFKEKFEIIE